MKLRIITIVLDGMLFLPSQMFRMNQLDGIDWNWTIAHGSARNVKDTSWCQKWPDRLSTDGTTAFLRQISRHPRITVLEKAGWNGKTEMVNACLAAHDEDCVLLQVDVDEMWTAKQIEGIYWMMTDHDASDVASFYCRYFVGPDIIITSDHNYGNRDTEWVRCWNFTKGQRFVTHEPPLLSGLDKPAIASKLHTRELGLVFDHYAYAFREQVLMKEKYYGYRDAVKYWERLQANTVWPVMDLRSFLPWVDKGVTADKVGW